MIKTLSWQDAANKQLDHIALNIGATGRADTADQLGRRIEGVVSYVSSGAYQQSEDEELLGRKLLALGPVAATELDTMGLWSKGQIGKMLARKQHDYGHGNINAFGMVGIAVRMSDKVARLLNLLAKGAEAENESLVDTYLDIVGYAVIAGMLLDGTFDLELA
jgi:plasmid stabilization system protein ParE